MSFAPTEGRDAGATDLVRTQRASGSGAIVDPGRLHRDQRARGARRPAHPRRGAERSDRRLDPGGARPGPGRPHRRHRSRDGSGRRQGRGDRPADAVVRRFRRPARRAVRHRARQPARLLQLRVARCRERGGAAARARVADGLRAERRGDQLRQQRRPPRRSRAAASSASTRWSRRAKAPPARASASPRRATSSAASTSRSARTAASAAATSGCGRRR